MYFDTFKRKKAAREAEIREENRLTVANTICVIDENIKNFTSMSKNYEEQALKAALISKDDFANELLERSTEIDELVDDLSYIKLELESAAITSDAFSTFGRELTNAIAACKSVFSAKIDFSKLGNDMASLKDTIKGIRSQIGSFRENLRGKSSSSVDKEYERLYGAKKKATTTADFDKKLVEKKKALEANVIKMTQNIEAPTPVDVKVDNKDVANIDTIVGIIDSMNNDDK